MKGRPTCFSFHLWKYTWFTNAEDKGLLCYALGELRRIGRGMYRVQFSKANL